MRVARLSLVAHGAVGLAAFSLLMLGVHGSLIERVGAVTAPKPTGNLIRVWTVGSPFTGDLPQAAVPAELQRQAGDLGYTIEVKTFQAAGFAAKFRQALQEHNEPEVLTFDNYGVVWSVMTPAGRIEGVAADEQTASSLVMVHEALAQLQPRGWVLLVRSAVNYEAAKALSMRPPVCGEDFGLVAQSPTQPELRQAQETAAIAARAYLACDQSSLSAISDESRLGRKCFLPEDETKLEAVKACGVSGNRNLAFVSLVSTFSAQARVPHNYSGSLPSMNLGHQSLLTVLRNQGGTWRLLAITDDPTNTNQATYLATRRLVGLLDAAAESSAPEPVQLLTGDGVYPRPRQGQRFGDFAWRPSPHEDVVCEVAEFLVGERSGARQRTRLFFRFGHEGSISSGQVWGVTARWRVWSISKSGDVAFSEQHSYGR